MSIAKEKSAKSRPVVPLTDGATNDNLPVYPLPLFYDLSRGEKLSIHFRATLERMVASSMLYVGHKLQKLEGKSRIYEKSYPSHSHLKHRIIPPPPKELEILPPLFLSIHGGGFTIGFPWIDDEPNLWISSALDCLVISLNYTKAPNAQFPTPTNEIVDTVVDILADTSLRFDRSRVVIGGYSAGGNLCLSAASSPLLKDKLRGVLSWYPPVDWITDRHEKARSRPYTKASPKDGLMKYHDPIKRAYAPPGSHSDPRLSVTLVPRENFPKYILIVGAELDMLCKEAAVMAGRYANVDVESIWDKDVDEKYGFEAEGIKWVCRRGALHGFTHTITNFGSGKKKKMQVARDHYEEIFRWLAEGPFMVEKPSV